MNNRRTFIIILAILITLPTAAAAAQNRAIKNPATVPPSSLRSGLVRSPVSPYIDGNRIITGNVSGGKHFRGIVPYNSVSDFAGRLSPSSIDYFLRDSTGTSTLNQYTGKLTPYFSQTRTVTTTSPYQPSVIRPPTANITGRSTTQMTLPTTQRIAPSAQPKADISLRTYRPMSMTTQEMEKIIASELTTYKQARDLADRQQQQKAEEFHEELKKTREQSAELNTQLQDIDQLGETPAKDTATKKSPLLLLTQTTEPLTTNDKQLDIFDKMKRQLDQLKKASEQKTDSQPAKQPTDKLKPQKPDYSYKKPDDQLSEEDVSARAAQIMGQYDSFASFSEDKFNLNIRAAEEYLKQGRFYRAADAYSLALIYKPHDPLAYAGKCHALFAAGEYMSSALFLSRALEIFPDYVRFKIDIETMVGDRDTLETRIADIRQMLEKDDVPELQFLLAYIYYQMGRLDRANQAIKAAYEKMAEAPAVVTLKKAVGDALESQ